MLVRLLLLFLLVPFGELAILVWMGKHVGVVPTIALVMVTGVLGAALARRQGLATWARFRAATAAGRPPHRELVEGLLVLVAGALLLTPGLLTDTAGFLLLVPVVRGWVSGVLTRRLAVRFLGTAAAVAGPPPRGGWRARESGGVGGGGGARDVGGTGAAVEADYRVLDDDAAAGTGRATGDHHGRGDRP